MNKETFCALLSDIDVSYVAEARENEKKRWLGAKQRGVIVACLCLVLVGTFVLTKTWEQNEIPTIGGDVIPPAEPTQTTESAQPARNVEWNINQATDRFDVRLDMDVRITDYFDLDQTSYMTVPEGFEAEISQSYEEIIGKIPTDFILDSFYSIDTPSEDGTAYAPHDYVLEWQTDEDGRLRLLICAKEKPLRDYFYKCAVTEKSQINDTDMVVYSYENSYSAQFSYKGANYDLEATYVTLGEMEEFLIGFLTD